MTTIYNYFINGGNKSNHDKNKIKNDLDINDFLNEYNENNLQFLKTQYSYLQDSEHIKLIGKFENFDTDLKNIMKDGKIDQFDIPEIMLLITDLITTSENAKVTTEQLENT